MCYTLTDMVHHPTNIYFRQLQYPVRGKYLHEYGVELLSITLQISATIVPEVRPHVLDMLARVDCRIIPSALSDRQYYYWLSMPCMTWGVLFAF